MTTRANDRRRRRRRAWIAGTTTMVAAAVLGVRAPAAAAAEATWLAPVSGNWTDPVKWSTSPVYPNNLATDVVIGASGAPYTVSLATNVSAGLLTLGSPDATLNLTDRTLTLGQGLHLDGGLFLVTAPDLFSAARVLRGTLPITGAGQIVARGGSLNVEALDASLAIGAGVTLRAEQGGKLTLRSLGAENAPQPFTTAGTIVADGAGTTATLVGPLNTGTLRALDGGTLSITALGGGGPVNEGTIELAGASSKLLFSSAEPIRRSTLGSIVRSPENAALPNVVISARIDNAGSTLSADSFGGRWAFDPAASPSAVGIVGGTIVPGADPEAELTVRGCLDGVTIDGRVAVTGDWNETLSIPGDLTVNGVLRIGGELTVNVGGTGTWGGTGVVVFDEGESGRSPSIDGGFTIGPGLTFKTGTGGVRLVTGTFEKVVNRGTIVADTPGATLAGDYHNEGLIEVTNGSQVRTLDKNSGTVRVSDGGSVRVHVAGHSGEVIATSGGRLTLQGFQNPGPGTISVTDATVILDGVYRLDQVPRPTLAGDSTVLFSGTLDNSGQVLQPHDAPFGTLRSTDTFTLKGGTLGAAGDPEWTPDTGLTLDGVDVRMPVRATGALTLAGAWAVNAPLVLTGPGASLRGIQSTTPDAAVANITIADGARLVVDRLRTAQLSAFHFQGGIIAIGEWPYGSLDNAGSTLTFPDFAGGRVEIGPQARISGGTLAGKQPLTAIALMPLPLGSPRLYLEGVTLKDIDLRVPRSYEVTFSGGLTLQDARVTLDPTGERFPGDYLTILFRDNPVISGTGEIVFDRRTRIYSLRDRIVTTVSTGIALTVGNGITIRTGEGGGEIHGVPGGVLLNYGTISAQTHSSATSDYDGSLVVRSSLRVDNQGTMRASNGGLLSLSASPVNYDAATGTLTGGVWQVFAGSELRITDTTPVRIEVNAADVMLSGPGSLFPPFDFLATNAGTFTITDGRHFTTVGDLANVGTLRVGPDSVLTVSGALANGGTIDLDGGLIIEDPPAGGLAGATGVWTSSAVAADPSGLTVLASVLNDDGSGHPLIASLDGQPAPFGSLLVRCTLRGDANLDGRIDAADYYLIDRGYATRMAGWAAGDFDQSSGAPEVEDYLFIDAAFLRQVAGVTPGSASSDAPRPVPEPAAAALLLPAAGLLLRRRVRRPVSRPVK